MRDIIEVFNAPDTLIEGVAGAGAGEGTTAKFRLLLSGKRFAFKLRLKLPFDKNIFILAGIL